MKDIAALVSALGGMAQKQQLVRRGARDLDLTAAVKSGAVTRVRNGWYTTLPAGDERVQAVRVGGRLTGISAISALGGWVLGPHPLHVSVPFNAARLRDRDNRHRRLLPLRRGVILHWDDPRVGDLGTAMIVGLRQALTRVVVDESRETAIAALDWALHSGLIEIFDVHDIMLAVPAVNRLGVDWLDGACESLPESLARTRLREAGHHVVSQVPLETGEEVDLLVDGIVGLEVDGDEFHRDFFERDRRKDAHITVEHMHALRPSARMVFHDWARVLAAVETAIADRRAGTVVGNSGTKARNRIERPRKPRGRRPAPEFPKAARRE